MNLVITRHAIERWRQRVDPDGSEADLRRAVAAAERPNQRVQQWLNQRHVRNTALVDMARDLIFVLKDAADGDRVLLTVLYLSRTPVAFSQVPIARRHKAAWRGERRRRPRGG